MLETARQKAVYAVLFVVWLGCFVLSLDDVLRHTAYSPILVTPAEGPEDYPTVAGLKPGLGAEASGLRAGDRLLAAGGTDLRGAGTAAWIAAVAQFQGRGTEIPVRYARESAVGATILAAASHSQYWPRLVASVVFAGCALFLLLRLRSSRLARSLVFMNLVLATLQVCFFAGGLLETRTSFLVQGLSGALVLPASLRAFLMFPHGVPPRSVWARLAPWPFAVLGPFDTSRFYAIPFPPDVGTLGEGVTAAAFVAIFVAIVARGYRRSDRIQRRQFRWVLLGAYVSSIPFALSELVLITTPGAGWMLALAVSGTAVLPICMIIAIHRYNFLDIDRLLSATASLTLVVGCIVVGLVLAVPPAATAITETTGVHTAVARLGLAGVLAAFFLPAHRQLRSRIDRAFFAERYSLERGVAELTRALSGCEGLEALARLTGERLDALFQPRSCVVYTRSAAVLSPVFVSGGAAPPRFAAGSPLVAALEEQPGPLALDGSQGRGGTSNLGSFQRAVLETLDVSLVMPVRRDGSLIAFLCLGAKRSGDVYTPSDVALLSLVADRFSSELLRLDQTEEIRSSQELRERLRQYVPGNLADRLEDGESLDVGEADVSVLFVDLRGYSGLTESLSPNEIFSTVNRYTETVSAVIRARGGTVVEFNGDGMMAVFGAPQPLALKEQAAVAAGREIVERIPSLFGATPMAVGVGVATGRAFVGSVQAVDRLIWTALGNTTNLASRLQGLTRDLGAAMIIDESTWEHSGPQGKGFERRADLPIRGRRQRENVYLLPRPMNA